MSDQHSLPPPETVAAIRAIFFGRLAEMNSDIIQAHFDLAVQIKARDDHTCLVLLLDIENRLEAMHNILKVFEECFEG
jgi:deferrochelatase/peroxidase EfeB